jgi:hypothetical protein
MMVFLWLQVLVSGGIGAAVVLLLMRSRDE